MSNRFVLSVAAVALVGSGCVHPVEESDESATPKGAETREPPAGVTPESLGYTRLSGEQEHGSQIFDSGSGPVSAFNSSWRSPDSTSTGPVDLAVVASDAPTNSVADAFTRSLVAEANRRPADEMFDVELILQEDGPPDYERLGSEDESTRSRTVADRQAAIATTQDRVARAVEVLGGEVIARRWLVSSIRARVPASAIRVLSGHEAVVAIERSTTAGSPTYTGEQIRQHVMPRYADWSYRGESLGRVSEPSDNIKIGVIDGSGINTSHPAFRDCAGCASRIRRLYDCRTSTCVAMSLPAFVEDTSPSAYHALHTTGAAIADLLQNQDPDPSFTDVERARGTFLGREAEAYVYLVNYGDTDARAAVDQAVADGVDVISMSFATPCSSTCAWGRSCSGLRGALRRALLAGVVPVAAAGNSGGAATTDPYGCTLGYPASDLSTLAVGASRTLPDIAYQNQEREPWSSVGPVRDGSPNGVYDNGVDLLAPGTLLWVPTYWNEGEYFSYYVYSGTSLSAPVVSSMVGLLREGMRGQGLLTDVIDGRALMVNALLMGDGMGTGTAITPKIDTGFGRARGHIPNGIDLTAPFGWGWRWVQMKAGDEVVFVVGPTSGPEPTTLTEWKWAVMVDVRDIGNPPRVTIRAEDWCRPGYTGPFVIASDTAPIVNKMIQLHGSSIRGRCMHMRVIMHSAPLLGARIYSADYYHGGSDVLH